LEHATVQVVWFGQQLDHVPQQVDFLMILYHMPWMADEQTRRACYACPPPDALLYRKVLEAHLDHAAGEGAGAERPHSQLRTV
jgi:hypothetical protein